MGLGSSSSSKPPPPPARGSASRADAPTGLPADERKVRLGEGAPLIPRDPLVRYADQIVLDREEKRKEKKEARGNLTPFTFLLGLVLAILYTLVSALTILFVVSLIKNSTGAMWILVGTMLLIGLGLAFRRVPYRIGPLIVLAVLVGFFEGATAYFLQFGYYQTYMEMTTYTNVAASQSPESYEDASIIMFTSDTLVDISRAVGYQDASNTDTVCVAPVVDSSMSDSSEIMYWAVGLNCCLPRGSFKCGAAHDPKAQDGVLMLKEQWLAPKFLYWLIPETYLRQAYNTAITMAEAEYSALTAPASQRRLLTWITRPERLIDNYYNTGMTWVKWMISIDAIVFVLLSVFVGMRSLVGLKQEKDYERGVGEAAPSV